jgi:hypothetical protein
MLLVVIFRINTFSLYKRMTKVKVKKNLHSEWNSKDKTFKLPTANKILETSTVRDIPLNHFFGSIIAI